MAENTLKTVIFDLDGVITKTAAVHRRAWKTVFDEFLKERAEATGDPFCPFTENDYLSTVDGKPRLEGIQGFLASRSITLPMGEENAAKLDSVKGIGNKKNALFQSILQENGTDVFETSVTFIHALKDAGIRIGLATSSKNCDLILETTGLKDLFESKVDGVSRIKRQLNGKPEPDIFVQAAADLDTLPADAVVVEDANAGVAAGRNGGFGLVLGIARHDNVEDLLFHGADVAVRDLADISVHWIKQWFKKQPKNLEDCWQDTVSYTDPLFEKKNTAGKIFPNPAFEQSAGSFLLSPKKRVLFLDYDGTLTPIVSRPEEAIMSEDMRNTLKQLMNQQLVAIVSGRMRTDVENLVGIEGILVAGSHGFDIKGPDFEMLHPKAQETIPVIDEIIELLKKSIGSIPGIVIEEKKFSVAAHYRLVDPSQHEEVRLAVDEVMKDHDRVRMMQGKMVYEILPNIEWNKGMAIRWTMKALKLSWEECAVVYVGDDVTDENAFRVIRTRGANILVAEEKRPSAADFQTGTPDDIKKIFEKILNT